MFFSIEFTVSIMVNSCSSEATGRHSFLFSVITAYISKFAPYCTAASREQMSAIIASHACVQFQLHMRCFNMMAYYSVCL